MKKLVLAFTCLLITLFQATAQNRSIPIDTTILTEGNVTINGKVVEYTATTGTQPVWDESGKAIATLHYTYYKRKGVKDLAKRPLLISFNGGPGSASAWMHIGYTGPKLLNVDEEGYPVQPYGLKDNPHSVLDVTDILFVNPVNTGFSRTIPASGEEVNRKHFFGINADINYLSDWLHTFVNRHNRWLSPKYLIGESYGGTRVSGLAYALQEKQWMYLNGVILVSPADYKVFESDRAISYMTSFPYYTATAWYHKRLSTDLQSLPLESVLEKAEDFALNKLMPAMAQIGTLSTDKKSALAKEMSQLTGISEKVYLQNNLDISSGYFWKELLRDSLGLTTGRLDSRYLGLDKKESGSYPEYNAELNHWLHSFTPAINYYIREELGFKTDMNYNMFGDVHPWDRTNNNTRDNLRKAMASNPYLHVLFQAGYYDGATTYFNSKYTMWQLDPSGKMKDRISFKGYESGHMMYLRQEDLKTANDHIRELIQKSTTQGKSARY